MTILLLSGVAYVRLPLAVPRPCCCCCCCWVWSGHPHPHVRFVCCSMSVLAGARRFIGCHIAAAHTDRMESARLSKLVDLNAGLRHVLQREGLVPFRGAMVVVALHDGA
uniref:Putative secreted peptide n=1 Tax=Anopheles braziliensis TaxID=58242 RepID=A0A2M3ZPK1_9DIPT